MAKRTLDQQKADIEKRWHIDHHTKAAREQLDHIRAALNASVRDFDGAEKLAEQLLANVRALKAGPKPATAPESAPSRNESIPFPAAATGDAS
ncbi:MAG TPA: hypothetical protein VHM19_23085 [Polyangiales bacterium]|jgi:predicted AAA+ superfamily ATPase|nr:hypothetical protein [Polyangiales bacterium]